jgi:aspartyl-tRNA(Asn)/glutamyl-tRNA(Gln) amidotransferase subunit A
MSELNNMTLKEASEGLKRKKFSSVELTTSCLKSIGERDESINAFITVDKKSAIYAAEDADKNMSESSSVFAGIPFAVKDAICTEDVRSTGAAKILDQYKPPFEATVIKKIRESGGVLIGKNNCDSFGHGASNENSMYGPVRNPHDESKVAGGSSGGSAAAVAANMAIFSIGEDTGGSIRQPAALCGIAGLRPSYGRNSRYGIMPMASSLDTVGPMAKNVEDIAYIMENIAGKDEKDATTVDVPVPAYTEEIKKDIKGMKIGVPKEYFELEGLDPEVKQIVEANIKQLEGLGCKMIDISLPHTKYAIPVYYIIVPSEDSSNMGRLDGIRYGSQASHSSLYEAYAKSRAQGFPEEVKRRIMIGTYALSAGYYDAYYRKAQKVRTLITQDFTKAFETVDAIVTPTSPFPAFGLGEKKDDVLAMYAADMFVSPAALAGIPGLTLNGGFTKDKLPVGLQLIGPRMGESTILNIGYQLEQSQI